MKAIITVTEWEHSKDHYLYIFTPLEVIPKIQKYIDDGKIPTLNPQILKSTEEFFEKADVMLYPNEENKTFIEEQFNLYTDFLAIMAFVPGGFALFGRHYEVEKD